MKWKSVEKRREYHREWRTKNAEKISAYALRHRELRKKRDPDFERRAVAEWRKNNPEKTTAHRAVFVALRNGTLIKEPCFCGEEKVQAHHEDYSKPLEVMWLCKPHHMGADILKRKRDKKTCEEDTTLA
jgi:hypothetical protein